ncbi:3-oxoacyl-[acyl-carrier-protein] synthase-1 [Acinetobacter calcoaceticus]|uniref:3-oxoacyl-[acyl-carrier-protein] synthase-1 n=1 Tax=Acinetobacter calcoaceticus TaxID=471 RepID=A0A4R1XLV7_ACICA|nr:3-oxoacyl-[acyl-carrier-protein] synthase-1 [Acinetobacter calcoaceticus]
MTTTTLMRSKQVTSVKASPAVGVQFAASLSALGQDSAQLKRSLTQTYSCLSLDHQLIPEQPIWVGAYQQDVLASVPEVLADCDTRQLRFALTALSQIEAQIQDYVGRFDRSRLAIIVGTSTSGIADNEPGLRAYFQGDVEQQIYQHKQEMGCLAKALQCYLGWEGISYTVSTACSSSGKAFASAQRLLNADLADAVLVAGVDTLSKLTLNGFHSLDNLSSDQCRPCGLQRDGINIGEAASVFLLSRAAAPVMLLAAGESMDAWHISAPHPEGLGAVKAMQAALDMAQLPATAIDYLNLHGTATIHNDAMEIKAIRQVFAEHTLAISSTKHQTGHCLGAAAALEAFICRQVLLDQDWLPLHHAGVIDPDLDDQNYVDQATIQATIQANVEAKPQQPIQYVMSNSFAFGGSNISLIFGTTSACSKSL